jgi:hypothetical protein
VSVPPGQHAEQPCSKPEVPGCHVMAIPQGRCWSVHVLKGCKAKGEF